jgi:predicted nucleotidyltransferase
MFVEDILGTESKIKIIRTLLEINTAFTIENLEGETGLSRGIIHKELKRLKNINIVYKVEKQGKLDFYRINERNRYIQCLMKIFDLEKSQERINKIQLVTWNLLSSLVSKLTSTDYNIKRIILFGSIARGTSTIHSDIDLIIITEDDWTGMPEEIYHIVKDIQKKTKREINIDYIHEKEYIKNKLDLVREVRREGIILFTKDSEEIRGMGMRSSHWAGKPGYLDYY